MKPKIIILGLFFCLFFFGNDLIAETKSDDFDIVASKIEEQNFYLYEETLELLQTLRNLSEKRPNNTFHYTKYLYYETIFNYNHGKYDSLLVGKLNDHLDYLIQYEPDNLFCNSLVLFSLSSNDVIVNEYSNAFFHALQALGNFRELNDSIFIGKTLNLLGNISSQIYSYKLAHDYYSEALNYITPKDIFYFKVKGNLYMVNFLLLGDTRAVIDSMKSLLPHVKTLMKHHSELITFYVNLAGIYSSIGDLHEASVYYDTVTFLMQDLDNRRQMFKTNFSQAFYHVDKNQLDSGLYYYRQALNIAENLSNEDFAANCLLEISKIYDQLNQTDSAYHYMLKYNDMENDIDKDAKIFEATQSFISSLLSYADREVEIREQTIKNKNKILAASVIIIIAIIAVIIMLLIINRQKKNKQELLKENIDSKMREITSISLLLSVKNSLLVDIQEIIKQLPDNLKKEDKIKEINNLIKNNLNTETDWDTFVMHFEKVHPNFFTNLKKKSSNLTPTNLRFCAYFKLGLTTKEIANMLNITATTVKVTRFRLKKKFGLSEKESLDNFLAQI